MSHIYIIDSPVSVLAPSDTVPLVSPVSVPTPVPAPIPDILVQFSSSYTGFSYQPTLQPPTTAHSVRDSD